MITMITVQKESTGESNLSLIKRFNRRLRGAKIIQRAKALRYVERPLSAYKKKKQALKRLAKRADFERRRKLGLADDYYKKSD